MEIEGNEESQSKEAPVEAEVVSEKAEKEEKPVDRYEALSKKYDEQVAATPEPVAKSPKRKTVDIANAQPDGATSTQILEAPLSWSKDSKELFFKLDPAVQAEIAEKEAKREKIFNQKMSEFAEAQRRYQAIDDAFKPYADEWHRAGLSEAQVINQFLAWQQYLDKDPRAAGMALLNSYGIKPQDLIAAQQQGQSNPQMDAIMKELNGLKGYLQQQQQNQVAQILNSTHNEVEGFRNEKDEGGNLIHPHFDYLYPQIVPIARTLLEQNPQATEREIIDEAYQRAAWSDPRVRQQFLSQSTSAKQNEEQKRIEQVRAASSSVRGAPYGSTNRAAPKNGEDAVRRAWEILS